MDWLSEGEQTIIRDTNGELTSNIKYHCNKINNYVIEIPENVKSMPENFQLAYKISNYMNLDNVLPYLPKEFVSKDKIFRKRTVEQILTEGLYKTCSDIAVVYRSLLIANEVPSSYVETFHTTFIENESSDPSLSTHSLVKVFDEGKSIIVDPEMVVYYNDEKDLFNQKGYVVYKEGLDSWSIGIKSENDIITARDENKGRLIETWLNLLLDKAGELSKIRNTFTLQ
jgi:hypothetical protein